MTRPCKYTYINDIKHLIGISKEHFDHKIIENAIEIYCKSSDIDRSVNNTYRFLASVYASCIKNKYPVSKREIIKIFDKNSIKNFMTAYRNIADSVTTERYNFEVIDFIKRYSNEIRLRNDKMSRIINKYKEIQDKIAEKNLQNHITAITLIYMNSDLTISRASMVGNTSEASIRKYEKIIERSENCDKNGVEKL